MTRAAGAVDEEGARRALEQRDAAFDGRTDRRRAQAPEADGRPAASSCRRPVPAARATGVAPDLCAQSVAVSPSSVLAWRSAPRAISVLTISMSP